jgi:hypothetical protein
MKKYFAILLVAAVMFGSQIACADTAQHGHSNYKVQAGDALGIAGLLNDLAGGGMGGAQKGHSNQK